MGHNYYYRYSFNPAASGESFTEGSATPVDFGDVVLTANQYDAQALPPVNPPAITSVTSVTIAVQNATGADQLGLDYNAISALTDGLVIGTINPDGSGTIQAWGTATTQDGQTFPVLLPFAFISGGANGQPLVITLASAATQAVDSTSNLPSAGTALTRLDDLLDHILYATTSNAPPATRTIQYTFGGTYAFGQPTVAVNITPINDQPVLANGGQALLGTLSEHTVSAFQVSAFRQSFSDADGPAGGIAITAAATNNGHWEYSTDGSTWTGVGSVASNSALLLRDSDWVRFIGDGSIAAGGSATDTITYRIWDQFSGSAGTKVDTSSLNAHSPYSGSQASAGLTLTGVNDAPVLTAGAQTLTTINEDAIANSGQTVASFRGTISDADSGAVKGIAITAQSAGNGHWEYSTNGSTWTAFGAVAANHALLLRDTDLVRFVPDEHNGTAASFTYNAWDQTSGSAGGHADLTAAGATGGSTAFGTGSDTASITVTSVNDAPTATNLTQALTTLEGTPTALGIVVTDVDTGDTVTAKLTLGDPTVGSLTTTGGGSYDSATGIWTITGSVATVNAALAAVNYVPASHSDAPNTITTHIQDATGTGPADGTIAITITPVNDPPTVTDSTQVLSYTEGATSVPLAPITVADDDIGDTVTVTLTSSRPASGALQGTAGSYDASSGVWTFTGSVADANAALASVAFVPTPHNDVTTTISVHVQDAAGTGPADGTITLNVTPVEDVATITAANVVTTETKLPSFVFFNIANKVTILDYDTDDAAHPHGYVANSGSVTQIDGPTPPDDTLADLLTLDAASGTVLYDRSAFHWLTAGQQVVYTITFRAQSGDDAPQTKTLTVTIEGLNDAPVLATPNHQSFAAMSEDDPPSAAHKVADFRGSITDADPDAQTGIAITATVGNGEWRYSIDNGASWHSFVASDAAALLLRDQDLIRFAPDHKNGGPASFTYHAWDQTAGSAGDIVDVTVTGGARAFSHASDTVTLVVSSINDAPVLVADHMTWLPITEDDVDNAGQPVWTFLCNAISDVDNGAVQGIALTGTEDGNGHWEYSLDGGSTWASVGSVGERAALLLKGDDWMRFVPDGNNGTDATLTYHAWDQTSGTHGQSVDLTLPIATGGTTAFSIDTDTVSIDVSDVNDAPQVSGPVALTAVNEDMPRLITQAALLAHASDVDTVHTLVAADLQIGSGGGTLTDNHDGSWTYAPAQNDDSSVAFSFTVSDGVASPVATTATLDILPVNDAPVAQDGSAQGNEDTPIAGTVGATDVDNMAGQLTYALVGTNGGAQHGVVMLNPNGTYTYTPDHDYFGADSFSFAANDGQADSAAATVTIAVDPVNDPPAITTPTPITVAENETFVAALGATDVDGPNAATYSITGGADAALFDILGGNLVFRDLHDYETDAHSYQVEITAFDGVDGSTRLLTVDLTDVNDNAPLFTSSVNAPDIVPENTQGTVFSAAATDADGSASIAYSLSGEDAALFAVDPVTGKVQFVSAPDYEASRDHDHDNNYQVTLHANDGVHDAAQDLTITVTNINEAPVAANGSASGEQTIGSHLLATDLDSPSLTYTMVSGPSHGSLSLGADGSFSYAADLNYRGVDAFTFKANDGALDSNVATFSLNVTQLRLAGTSGNDSFTADGGNERIDGGGGTNTVTFGFKLTDATISFAGNRIIVDGPNGSHTVLTDFTIFKFADGTVDNTQGDPLVDKLYYYSQYHDVWNAHADADQHFMTAGWKEGRNPDALFDTNGYLAHNPDVAAAQLNPLMHYDQFGWQEGRDPSASFDTKAYLAANPDIAAAHIDPLAHFLQYGIHEGRTAFADGHF